ncbi:MAG: DNA integrity scanning protein DisA nucleotide-binding domain protein [Clostridia bacterium]|nr:DNA integrity scanning protein DisA nucleotide-binding domain protein [Clostridia bacterium]
MIDKLANFWKNLQADTNTLLAFIFSAVVFFILFFCIIRFLLENNADEVVAIIAISCVLGGILILLLNVSGMLFLIIPSIIIITCTILYSVEIKRSILTRKMFKFIDTRKNIFRSYDEERVNGCISEIIKSLQNMSKNDIGAIIVLSTGNIPSQIIDSGVKTDSEISSALIESVFFPKTPLHDGAMIINGTKIVAAGCFLPLSQNVDNIPKELGTRHRAGIGITETIDVTSLIVSEETGVISIAKAGKITRYADFETLKKVLTEYYWKELQISKK